MNRNHFKISTLVILCSLAWFDFLLDCKNPPIPFNPYDIPTAIANPPTVTAIFVPVNVSCYVTYGGSYQLERSWDFLDPYGNTINVTHQSSRGGFLT